MKHKIHKKQAMYIKQACLKLTRLSIIGYAERQYHWFSIIIIRYQKSILLLHGHLIRNLTHDWQGGNY